jgi:hypothetical protein
MGRKAILDVVRSIQFGVLEEPGRGARMVEQCGAQSSSQGVAAAPEAMQVAGRHNGNQGVGEDVLIFQLQLVFDDINTGFECEQ